VSSFLSNKYLKYRRLMAGGGAPAIAVDIMCVNCGYNLRGLGPGRNCPECGTQIPFEVRPHDPLLSGSLSEKTPMLWGLTFLALGAGSAVALRLVFAAMWALSPRGFVPIWLYIALTTVAACMWAAGAILALPRRLDAIAPRRRWLRIVGRWSQIAWPAGRVLWLLAATRYLFVGPGPQLMFWFSILSAFAGIGWLCLVLMLAQMSDDAELDQAPRRIGLAIYVVPVLAIVMAITPLDMRFFVLALLAPIVLAWAWYSVGLALGIWEMRQQVAWSLRLATDTGDREHRIMQARKELDDEATARVRALPVDAPDSRRAVKID
jgi:hypothetical protein